MQVQMKFLAKFICGSSKMLELVPTIFELLSSLYWSFQWFRDLKKVE